MLGEWLKQGTLAANIGPMGVHGIPANVRIATFEIPTLRPLVQTAEDTRASDGAGKGEYRLHAPREFMRNYAVLDYLQRLLTQELLDLCATALEAAEALEQARAAIDRPNGRHVVDCKVIPPNGLITFVDELVYHATPLEGPRNPEERRELFTTVGVGGKTDYKLPVPGLWIDEKRLSDHHVLTRTVSRDRLTAPVRGTDNKRRFLRLWICVQPKKWTK